MVGVETSSKKNSERDLPPYGPNQPSGASGAFTLMGGTLVSRLTGLLRNSLLNQLFPQTVTDAFTVAFKVPNLFRELLAEGALTNSFVPIYRGQSQPDARRLAGALAGMLFLVNGILLLITTLAAPWVVRLLLGSEGSVDFELAVQLTRVVFPFLAAISFSALAMGVLQANERFIGPAWAPVALNVVTVVLMLIFPSQAVPLALAFVFGAIAQFLIQIPFLVRYKLLPKLGHFWHPELAIVLVLMVPFAFTTGARQVLNVISTRILDSLEAGSQTAFFNADLFLSLALGLFSISPALAAQYPEEMTIVLEHQFWDLDITEETFSVVLSFAGKREKLFIPFNAVSAFVDPSVKFGLQFSSTEGASIAGSSSDNNQPKEVIKDEKTEISDTNGGTKDGTIVALDSYRKK